VLYQASRESVVCVDILILCHKRSELELLEFLNVLDMVSFMPEDAAQEFARGPEFPIYADDFVDIFQAEEDGVEMLADFFQPLKRVFRQFCPRESQAETVHVPPLSAAYVGKYAVDAPALAWVGCIALFFA